MIGFATLYMVRDSFANMFGRKGGGGGGGGSAAVANRDAVIEENRRKIAAKNAIIRQLRQENAQLRRQLNMPAALPAAESE